MPRDEGFSLDTRPSTLVGFGFRPIRLSLRVVVSHVERRYSDLDLLSEIEN
jgi:hypothetical protein